VTMIPAVNFTHVCVPLLDKLHCVAVGIAYRE
jgi:hypothetical protein